MANFPIVGIGMSAGGLEAAETFFKNMPDGSGMAFVLVFHLTPNHEGEVAALLQNHTPMPIVQIEEDRVVEPNHVYIIPPGHGLALSKGALFFSELMHANGRPTVIDHFFCSLAEEMGDRAIGIVLSGTGIEGGQGLKAIKEAGGMTVVQDGAECDGVRHSAILTGLIDFVLPVAEMPKKLLEAKDSAVRCLPLEDELKPLQTSLQTSAEELETPNEELQLTNEELVAVNQELQNKIEGLVRTNSDLNNFIANTEIGTLFLDEALRVRRYTPRLAEMFNLIATEVGRPFAHLAHDLADSDLLADAERVLRDLTVVEKEIVGRGSYLTRLRPDRTVDNKVGGVVMTFVDISEHYRHKEQITALNVRLETQRAYAASIVNTVREPLLVLDSDLRVASANRAFTRIFQTTPEATEHKLLYELDDDQWDIPELRRLLEEILPQNTTVEDFEVRHDFAKLGEPIMMLNARRLEREEGLEPLILLAFEDITERKRAERVTTQLGNVVNFSEDAIISKDLAGVITSWNKSAEQMFGYSAEEAIGQPITALIIPPDRLEEEEDILRRLAQGERIEHFETVRRRKDGSTFDLSVTISPLREQGRVVGASKTARDITRRKRAEEALQKLNENLNRRVEERTAELALASTQIEGERERFRTIFELASAATAITTLEGRLVDGNKNFERLFGLAKGALAGHTLFDIGIALEPARYEKLLKVIKRRGYARRVEFQVTSNGEMRDILVSWELMKLGGETRLLFMAEDVSEQRELARELHEARYQLLEKREQANLTLARDLHDIVVQQLIGTGYGLEASRNELVPRVDDEVAEALEKALLAAQGRVLGAASNLRRLISELRPPGLLEFGLEESLRRYLKHLNREMADAHEALTITLHLDSGHAGEGGKLSYQVSLVLFRVAQEALRNARKHAQASHAEVILHLGASEARLDVRDDGVGFTPPIRLALLSRDDHFGLVGISEQLSALGGRLEVRSAPGKGTELTAIVPAPFGHSR